MKNVSFVAATNKSTCLRPLLLNFAKDVYHVNFSAPLASLALFDNFIQITQQSIPVTVMCDTRPTSIGLDLANQSRKSSPGITIGSPAINSLFSSVE